MHPDTPWVVAVAASAWFGGYAGWLRARLMKVQATINEAATADRIAGGVRAANEEAQRYLEAAEAISAERWRAWEARGFAVALLSRMRVNLPDPVKLELLAAWLDAKYEGPGSDNPQVQNELREWAREIRTFHEQIHTATTNPATMSPDAWESHKAANQAVS